MNSVLERDPQNAVDRHPARRWRLTRRAHVLIIVVLVALFASALGYLVNDQLQEHRQFDRAHTASTITHHRTTQVSRQLADLRRAVNLLQTQVGSDSTALTQDGSQLKAAQLALLGAEADVSQQTTLIASLHTCLGGVEQALNELAIGQQSAGLAELNSVSTSCSAAAAASG